VFDSPGRATRDGHFGVVEMSFATLDCARTVPDQGGLVYEAGRLLLGETRL